MSANKLIFVIEHCENCQLHQWNTRHDPKKYQENAIKGKLNS